MRARPAAWDLFEGIEFDNQLPVALDIARAFKGHIDAAFLRPEPQSILPPVTAAAGGRPRR